MLYFHKQTEGETMHGTDTGRIIAIRHLPKIEIKNTLLSPLF
jgi:hypothetical protein